MKNCFAKLKGIHVLKAASFEPGKIKDPKPNLKLLIDESEIAPVTMQGRR